MRSTVKDVMTTRTVAVRKDATFKEMIAEIKRSRVSAFPVIDDARRVIGVVSEADMLDKEADLADSPGLIAGLLRLRAHEKAAGITASDLMTSPAVTIGPDAPVAEAARLMRDRRVKRLPVINVTGHLIGVISRADVLSVFTRPDNAIREEITKEVILRSLLMAPERFTVAVRSGIVTISGHPETDQTGRDLIEAARRVEGVVAVRDRLDYAGNGATPSG